MEDGDKKINSRNFLLGIISVLVILNITLLFFYFSKGDGAINENFWKNYPLLSPERGFYAQKDLIVNIQPLRDELTAIGQDQNISIYFEFLNTGANVAVNKDVKIWPASLMKIPIAIAVMKKIEDGKWKTDGDFFLKDEDKNNEFGKLYEKKTGTRFSAEDLLDEMLINSDNTARNIFVRNMQWENVDDVLEHLGMEYDYKNDERITAKKYSIFWRSLFTSSYLTPENSQKLIDIMSHSATNEYLSQGMPSEVKFSHKIGVAYESNVYSDSGIVYIPSRPFILTVMIKGHTKEEAQRITKEISEKTYKYIAEYR